jgi:hypothetical protein
MQSHEVHGHSNGPYKQPSQDGKHPENPRIKYKGPEDRGNHWKKAEGSCSPPLKKAWKLASYCPKAIQPRPTMPKPLGPWGIMLGAC